MPAPLMTALLPRKVQSLTASGPRGGRPGERNQGQCCQSHRDQNCSLHDNFLLSKLAVSGRAHAPLAGFQMIDQEPPRTART
jgi:hypothetical protein